ncbi:predicted protein [Naegleria gruberi]|uniref:Predicted protein n=1 Tax=Naegleria gruberi TaxID=5762 RepID=D2VDN6_NAEGR|nr:uncharacterized protein NAEGRDRAFT_66983 [Naegleria gruberi]EFC44929.1 predicted protein [Naegleria gruberi]|eukprot:XP_002677673.1 predicted protein [Naegleria gruberi strain NEG-M]
MSRVKQRLEYYGFDASYFIGEEGLFSGKIHHDKEISDENLCIELMILIYHYLMCCLEEAKREFGYEAFHPYFCYLEEKIFPGFFDCAKRVAERSNVGQDMEAFETGVESLENWQQFILQLYVQLQCGITTSRSITEFGENGCSVNSCFLFFTLLKYFLEKKEKFLKENKQQVWELPMEKEILFKVFEYWSRYITFCE